MGAEVITTRSARVDEILRHKQGERSRRMAQKAADSAWAALRAKGAGYIVQPFPSREPEPGQAFSDIMPDRAWAGRRCFIVGGGASLLGFDFSKLRGELVIGVNRAYESVDCQILFSMDTRLYDWAVSGQFGDDIKHRFETFAGYKVWLDFTGEAAARGVHVLKGYAREGLSQSLKDGLSHGNNSGHGALNLAYCLGANPIYLLGFDMKFTDGKSHFHSGYPSKNREETVQSFIPDFERAAGELSAHGVQVVNLNPGSALKAFPFGRFEDIPKISRPVVVSYYTSGTGYEKEAEFLRQSLRRWNLEHDIEAVDDLGSWQENTRRKARFILRKLDEHPGRGILFVDADAVVRSYPFELENIGEDVALCFRDYARYPVSTRNKGKELLTGTIYFSQTPAARDLLNRWIAENDWKPTRWEQRNLETVLGRYDWNSDWKGTVKELSASYCRIFDQMADSDPAVFEHFQASRRLRDDRQPAIAAAPDPKISIVMPTYNQGRFIRQAIDSILQQTFRDFELIVVDDGSTDGTAEILRSCTDPRVRCIRKENGGTGSALNAGFAQARAPLETWFSSDNVLYPQALATLAGFLGKHSEVDYVYGNCEIGVMDQTGERELQRKNITAEIGPMEYRVGRTMQHYFFGIAWLWRRQLRLAAGGEFQKGPCEDYDMVLRMEEAGGCFYYLSECLAWFRRHPANMTARTGLPIVSEVKARAAARRAAARTDWHLKRIPRVAHFYWEGRTLPFMRLLTLRTFCRQNPTWKVVLHVPATGVGVETIWSTFEHSVPIDAADCSAGLAALPVDVVKEGVEPGYPAVFRSDALRWRILARHGGLWSDMDILWTKPIEAMEGNKPGAADVEWSIATGEFKHAIGFILAAPGNPFYAEVDRMAKAQKPTGYQDLGAALLNRAFPTRAAIEKRFPGHAFLELAGDVVYAYATHAMTERLFGPRGGQRLTTPRSIGVHWYAGHPAAGRAINRLTAENWRNEDMLICEYIRKALGE